MEASRLCSRRAVLISLSSAVITLAVARPAFPKYEFAFYKDDEFEDPDWKSWLRDVVGTSRRMIEPHVINNYLQLHGDGHYLGPDVWERSNNARESRVYWRQKKNLLEWQLKCLQINDFQPDLKIHWAYNRDADWWGRGSLGSVAIIYDEKIDDVKIEGQFEVWLNTYWATTNDSRNTRDLWGGVVAHEMLHNLGHNHGEDQYDDRWPINILERCVINNGTYRGGFREDKGRCCGCS